MFSFFMIFFMALLSESPLVLVFSLIGMSISLSVTLFLMGMPMLCYMWILVYIGGMMIVFIYVVFFSLNSWMSNFSPSPGSNFILCFFLLSSGVKSGGNYIPSLSLGHFNSISDLILSSEISWSMILFIFVLMCLILNIVLQMLSSFSLTTKVSFF